MTLGSAAVLGISAAGVSPQDMLLVVTGMCGIAALLAQRLHRVCDAEDLPVPPPDLSR
jgi:hypothetical protein